MVAHFTERAFLLKMAFLFLIGECLWLCPLRAQSDVPDMAQLERSMLYIESLFRGDSLSSSDRATYVRLYLKHGVRLAGLYSDSENRRYDDARDVYSKLLSVVDEGTQPRIWERQALTWYKEGRYRFLNREYGPALTCMGKALNGFQRAESDSRFVMNVLREIAYLKDILSDNNGALLAYQIAEQIASQRGLDRERMFFLCELFKHYDMFGESTSAARVLGVVDSLYQVSIDPFVKFTFNDFRGDQAIYPQKQYRQAEHWYAQNKRILPQLSSVELDKHYNNMVSLYSRTDRWDEALHYATLIKELRQKGLNPKDADFYSSYRDLVIIYGRRRDSIHCFQYMDSLFMSIPLLEAPLDKSSLYVTRANLHKDFGNYREALGDYRSADSVLATRYDTENGHRVRLLPLMAALENHLGNFSASERLYQQYTIFAQKLYGERSGDFVDALGYQANAEAFAGHTSQACQDYTEAVGRLKKFIRNRWPYLTYSQREGYWSQYNEWFLRMTPFALEAKQFQTPFTETCYDGLILTKSFLLDSEQSTFDLILRHGTEEDSDLFARIRALQDRIRVWERAGSEQADSIVRTSVEIDRLETALAKRCRIYGDVTSFMGIDYKRIKKTLGNNDVLLDFTDFISESRGRIYATYIVNKRQKYPILKELFPERVTDSLQVLYPHQYYSGNIAKCVYNLIWKPLEKHIKKGSTVYYVPTQMLFQIALESIPLEDGTLLGDHYNFVRLSSARELVRYKASLNFSALTDRKDAVLYGGLQYSLNGTTMAQEASKHDVPRMLVFRGDDERLKGQKCFNDLPGTQEEIDSIYTTLKSVKLTVQPYSGKEGTEESFLSMSSKAPKILHMATHGFYYTPDAAQKVDYLRGYTDAMSLSGLVLAGGNAAWLGQELPEGVLGGILTAADIARMDLSGTEMVVLSACHSGKGEATPEGLYGLQRAFKKAGVKTIIMSLWAESDVVGPEFMTLFYKNLVGNSKWNKRKAFDAAKDAIRKKYPDTPSCWAGFVMLD